MLETKDLIIDKSKLSDWEGMYRNVWSRPESARYMMWNITDSEEKAKIRMQKTIEWQKEHDTFSVYEKSSAEPIGFAGIEELGPEKYGEAGICLGPEYTRKGCGKQILSALIEYCRDRYGAKEFIYQTREENIPSVKLAKSFGFELIGSEIKTDGRDGHEYNYFKYSKKI